MTFAFDRPLAAIDFETDGRGDADPVADRIIQIGLTIIEPRNCLIRTKASMLIHPGLDFLPLLRTDVHGIEAEQLVEAKPFRVAAPRLFSALEGCDLITYNGDRYDIPLLWEEFHRNGIDWDPAKHRHVDVATLWRKLEPRTLSDAVRVFLGREHEGAHSALDDCFVLPQLLDAMALKIQPFADGENPKRNIADLAALTRPTRRIGSRELPTIDLQGLLVRSESGEALYTNARVRGVGVSEDRGYGWWLYKQPWVSEQSRACLHAELTKQEETAYAGHGVDDGSPA